MKRLFDKIRIAEDDIIQYDEDQVEDADVVVVSYGISSRVAERAIRMARGHEHQGRPFPHDHRLAVSRRSACASSAPESRLSWSPS